MKTHTITIIETDSHVEVHTSFNVIELIKLGKERSFGDDLALAAANSLVGMFMSDDEKDGIKSDDKESSVIH